jgi:hypothetical protein
MSSQPHSSNVHLEPEQLLVNAKVARRVLGDISARFLWQLTKDGDIPSVRVRGRVMYSMESLRAWVRDHTEATQ